MCYPTKFGCCRSSHLGGCVGSQKNLGILGPRPWDRGVGARGSHPFELGIDDPSKHDHPYYHTKFGRSKSNHMNAFMEICRENWAPCSRSLKLMQIDWVPIKYY